MPTAKLKLHSKKYHKSGLIVELKLWDVGRSKNYPEGYKYSLAAVRPGTKKKVLMDNHSPKGHHYHVNEDEFPYIFQGLDQLVDDFKDLVFRHMGEKI